MRLGDRRKKGERREGKARERGRGGGRIGGRRLLVGYVTCGFDQMIKFGIFVFEFSAWYSSVCF